MKNLNIPSVSSVMIVKIKLSVVKGTVSPYKCIFSNGSRMGIPISQSSMWVMWFCDVAITPLARACPAELALRPRSGVYFGVSYDFASVLKDAEGPAYLSFRCVAFISWAYPPS